MPMLVVAQITLILVGIFTVAGLYGVWFLARALQLLTPRAHEQSDAGARGNVGTIVTWWLITYGIVGTQRAWLMRPFIGSPETPFSIFRRKH